MEGCVLPWRGKTLDAGGVLAVLSGALGIFAALFIFLGWTRYSTFYQLTGVIAFIAGVVTIWGARRYVFTGKNYWLAILFGVFAVVSGLLFGAIALIFIASSKREF
jgi:hypothetical protein